MITNEQKEEYYKALLNKDSQYEGIFFVGVKTTAVFCRPTCPAKKPLRKNCEFFTKAQEALLASYRPCKRCRPLSYQISNVVQKLVEAVEQDPEKRWKDSDFAALSIHAATARRQFQKRFGMTFVAYARARRLGIAMQQIRSGDSVIDAQISAGYESGSGFRDAFSKIMGNSPSKATNPLKATWIDTFLGPMIAIADEEALYLLEFVDRRGLEREIERLRRRFSIIPGRTKPIDMIEKELEDYFSGKLKEFYTPIKYIGTPFQKKVWEALQRIPYGESRSYAEQAKRLGKPTAYRAVAGANGANQLAIIIPCHRVRGADGSLTGYGGGLERKRWLLDHEGDNRSEKSIT